MSTAAIRPLRSNFEFFRSDEFETNRKMSGMAIYKYVSSQRGAPHETNIRDSRRGFLGGRHRLRAIGIPGAAVGLSRHIGQRIKPVVGKDIDLEDSLVLRTRRFLVEHTLGVQISIGRTVEELISLSTGPSSSLPLGLHSEKDRK